MWRDTLSIYEQASLILVLVQTVVLALAAFGALWYAWDNRKIRQIMWRQVFGNRPRLQTDCATSIASVRGVPEDIHVSLSNVGAGSAVDIKGEVRRNWDGGVVHFPYPSLDSTRSQNASMSNVHAGLANHLSARQVALLDISVEYQDTFGATYRYKQTQEYDPTAKKWHVVRTDA